MIFNLKKNFQCYQRGLMCPSSSYKPVAIIAHVLSGQLVCALMRHELF